MTPKVSEIEVSKSKKDNIYCLYFKLNTAYYNIEMYSVHPSTNNTTLELHIGTHFNERIIGILDFNIHEIWDKFEFPYYDIRKAKDEFYVYFYEYPYENHDIEIIDINIVHNLRK